MNVEQLLVDLKARLETTENDSKEWKKKLVEAEDDLYWMKWNITLGPEYATTVSILEGCIAILEDEEKDISDLTYSLRAELFSPFSTGSHPSVSLVENMRKSCIVELLNSRKFWELRMAVLG